MPPRTLARALCLAGAAILGACSLTAHLDDLQGGDAGAAAAGGTAGAGGGAGAPGDSGSDSPVAVTPQLPLGALAAGGLHGCLLDAAGEVFCWGSNLNGQLGNGTLGGKQGKLVRALLPEKAKSVGCGAYHSCAVGGTGKVYCWGGGSAGQLGTGTSDLPTPTEVPGLDGFSAVAAGASHSCALGASEVRCWGSNARRQLGVSTPDPKGPQAVPIVATSLAAGALHTCVISGGKVHCWGANDSGQLGEPGLPDQSQPLAVEIGAASPKSVAGGGRHSCATTSDGNLACWGNNAKGQLGLGTTGAAPVAPTLVAGISVAAIALGDSHSCAVTTGGASACWGDDAGEQIGNGPGGTPVLAPHQHSLLQVSAVAAGNTFSCALVDAGKNLYCWGDNKTQQIGQSTNANEALPVQVL